MGRAGWTILHAAVAADAPTVATHCGGGPPHSYMGFSENVDVGTASLVLPADGSGTLTYANCWDDGAVKVYLNGGLISKAYADSGVSKGFKAVGFQFKAGDTLEVKDEDGNAVVALKDLTLDCPEVLAQSATEKCNAAGSAATQWDAVKMGQAGWTILHDATAREAPGLAKFCGGGPPNSYLGFSSNLDA